MPKKKTVGKYELGKVLGEGTFGKVQLGTDVETGKQVAVKIIKNVPGKKHFTMTELSIA